MTYAPGPWQLEPCYFWLITDRGPLAIDPTLAATLVDERFVRLGSWEDVADKTIAESLFDEAA